MEKAGTLYREEKGEKSCHQIGEDGFFDGSRVRSESGE